MAHGTMPLWSTDTAPVHINVGGTIYTSDLSTLTKFPNSKLAQMLGSSRLIDIDSRRKGYFINRDGIVFRHILNFLRTNKLILPEGFPEMDLLLEEATFYEIEDLSKILIKQLNAKSGFKSVAISNRDTSSTLERESMLNKKFGKRRRYGKNTRYPLNHKSVDEPKNDEYSINFDNNYYDVEKIPEAIAKFQENGLTNRQLGLDCDIICIATSMRGAVEEVWSSSNLLDIDNFPETLLVKKVHVSKCDELEDFLFSTCLFFYGYAKCSNCSEYTEFKYVWNEEDIGCEFCIRNTEKEMMSSCKRPTKKNRVTVGFPWLAKYFMKIGFKLISTCASQNSCLIYHYFVK